VLHLSSKRSNLRPSDQAAWVYLHFEGATRPVDLSRIYATTWLALKLDRNPGRLAVAFWDDHRQIGHEVMVAQKGRFIPADHCWYVPMEAGSGLRLDLVRGIAVGEVGATGTSTINVSLPIRLTTTGRIDNRPLNATPLSASVTISVNPAETVKGLKDYGFGCHWDLCEGMPESGNLAAPVSFYRDMGFNMVRTSAPLVPADDRDAQIAEMPRRSWPKLQPKTFIDLVALYKKAGFDQIATILPFNEYFQQPSTTRPTLAAWSRNLPSEASFLRASGSFPIRYYELGNEIWSKDNRMGGAAIGDRGEYIGPSIPDALRLYSTRIKAVDPEARFMASFNGFDSSWPYLMQALPALDIINFSFYGWQSGYDKLRSSTVLSIADAERRLRAVAPEEAKRIKFGATEFAPHDWAPGFGSEGWQNPNDLGHALWGFDQAAESLADPNMAFACQWTVRWFWGHEDTRTGRVVWRPYDLYPSTDWDLLTFDNRLTAFGRALRFLGRNRLDEVVRSQSDETPQVMSFAVRSRDRRSVNLFVLNKDYGAKKVALRLSGFRPKSVEAQVFTGQGLYDPEPTVHPLASKPTVRGDGLSFTIPELSVTMVAMRN